MVERTLNAFWVLFGLAAAVYAWGFGLVGPSGPDSGLFPFIAAVIVTACGVTLMLRRPVAAFTPDFPRGRALQRVLGVVAGLALMAAAISYFGFAVAGTLTMLVLLRYVEEAPWPRAILIAVASNVAVIFIFGHFLGMALPRGPWGW
jgi:putative tricarboxylic transport membrane protein